MISKTDIFNEVCLSLGKTPDIQNADTETSNVVITIRGSYELSRKTILRDHPWGFAQTRVKLTSVGTPPSDWKYQYLYPSDCLKAVEIEKANRSDRSIPYKVSQYQDDDNGLTRVILTDQPDAVLLYTRDEDNEALFDPQFIKVFVAYLAYRCARTLTTGKDEAEKAFMMYQRARFEAMTSDSNEQIPDDQRDADWISGRN